MENMESKNVFYGSRGMLWIDGYRVAEVLAVKAELKAEKIKVPMAGHMSAGYKVVGYEGKGSFKMHKVTSHFINKFAPSIKEGKQVLFTLISEVNDPDAVGNERLELFRCSVDNVVLADWAVGKISEETCDFTFEDYNLTDSADA